MERGTGPGLPLYKKLIEISHGKIEVESEPGEGTKFTIQLQEKFKIYSDKI